MSETNGLRPNHQILKTATREYEIVRATPYAQTYHGLETLIRLGVSLADPSSANPEALSKAIQREPTLLREYVDHIKDILGAFMVRPRFFEGHPADCPEDRVTFEEMGEDWLAVYNAITLGGDYEALARAGRFPSDERGAAVPGVLPAVAD